MRLRIFIFMLLIFGVVVYAKVDTVRNVLRPIPDVPINPDQSPSIVKDRLRVVEDVGVVTERPPMKRSFGLDGIPQPEVFEVGKDALRRLELSSITQQNIDMSNSYSLFVLDDFRGGLNIKSLAINARKQEMIDLSNALWTKEGELVRRPGYGEYIEVDAGYDSIAMVIALTRARKNGSGSALHNVCLYEVDTGVPGGPYHSSVGPGSFTAFLLTDDWVVYADTMYYADTSPDTPWEADDLDTLKMMFTIQVHNDIRYVRFQQSYFKIWYDSSGTSTFRVIVPDADDSCGWWDCGTKNAWEYLDDYPSSGGDAIYWRSDVDGSTDAIIETYTTSADYSGATIDSVQLYTNADLYGQYYPIDVAFDIALTMNGTRYSPSTTDTLPKYPLNNNSKDDTTVCHSWVTNPATATSWVSGDVDSIKTDFRVVLESTAGLQQIDYMYIKVVTYKHGVWFKDYYMTPEYQAWSGSDYLDCSCGDSTDVQCVNQYNPLEDCYLESDRVSPPSVGSLCYWSMTSADDSVGLAGGCAEDPFNFLYKYYKSNGFSYLLGGTDTALYVSSDSCFEYITGTDGTIGRWDGCTFEDMFVGVHEGIVPIIWDGLHLTKLGEGVDSFKIIDHWHPGLGGCATYEDTSVICVHFYPDEASWTDGEWAGYTFIFPATLDTTCGDANKEVERKALILDNTADKLEIMFMGVKCCNGRILGSPDLSHYGKIRGWFDVDSILIAGKVDSISGIDVETRLAAYLWDYGLTWDSTFNWGDYIFEVVGGKGKGFRTYLQDWNPGCAVYLSWDVDRFIVYGADSSLFDTTTSYRIFLPSFWVGSKFVENFDGRLWLGWTGVGDDQNKNRIVYSGPSDLRSWPPENNIWVESDDGDFITGMIQFYPDQQGHRAEPWSELVVSKQQSLYRIYPTTFAGELDYKTMFISRGVGCCANAAMSMADGSMLLFPDQHGIWKYQGVKPVLISASIDPIFEAWNLSGLEGVSAIYNPQDRHYYISYPDDDSTYNTSTLAWSVDYNGWSEETFQAAAYCYQHSATDTIKMLFSDPDSSLVYSYNTQSTDLGEPIVLTYQSPYLRFSAWPSFKCRVCYLNIETYAQDSVKLYLDWYVDYGTFVYSDSVVMSSGIDIKEVILPDTLIGQNVSLKLTTLGTEAEFALSRIFMEYIVEENRR